MSEMISTLVTSVGLGVGAGVNAYATFLVFGLVSRLYPHLFTGDLARFFSSTPVLIVVGVLYVIEFFADKIPAVDHIWDVVHTFIRPLAGGVIAVAAMRPDFPRSAVILAALISGTAALGSHAVKASVRTASTVTTGGAANPLLSIGEDILAFGGATLAIFLPYLFLAIAIALLLPALFLVIQWVRRRRRARA